MKRPPRTNVQWLALREDADSAAHAIDLVARLRAALPATDPIVIRDLGCGTGAMGRWLAPRLPGSQHWIAHDRDPDMLALVEDGMSGLADAAGVPVRVSPRPLELSQITAEMLRSTTLVTASALLDVLTDDETRQLAVACAAASCPALLTLSVTGEVELVPPEPLDEAFRTAFNTHQRRTSAGRELLGPAAVHVARAAFESHGAAVWTRASPWWLDRTRVELTEVWLRGWVRAAVERRPDLAEHATGYLERRLGALWEGRLVAKVPHEDLLALPNSHGADT